MNTLTLQQLINICFLEDDIKKDAITKLPTMTDDQKSRLEEICWENLNDWFVIRYEEEKNKMLLQMAEKDAEYTPDDFEAVKDKLLTELLTKISEVKTNDELVAVKQQLKEKLTVPVQNPQQVEQPAVVNPVQGDPTKAIH
jgi:hypothetical protein